MITGLKSYHDNHKEDRRWAIKYGPASGVSCRGQGWSGWRNDWDKQLTFECPTQQALYGIHSYHSNSREDRRWEFRCCIVSGADLRKGGWTGDVNGWDSALDYRCELSHEVVIGLSSYHDNHREDRRWKFRCAELLKN